MEPPSRIFTRNLPPNISEADFRKHFAQRFHSSITDLKLFAQRRIGYIGFKTPEDATAAVKYFNRSFIRMSRISVELAHTPATAPPNHAPPTAKKPVPVTKHHMTPEQSPLKRKRPDVESAEDPKLKEYLEAMKAPSKKTWADEVPQPVNETAQIETEPEKQPEMEIEEDPALKKRRRGIEPEAPAAPTMVSVSSDERREEQQSPLLDKPVDDMDWMRSRTSRLLGLVDDDEEHEKATGSRPLSEPASPISAVAKPAQEPTPPPEEGTNIDGDEEDTGPPELKAIRESSRLFLRNLPYSAQEEDLQALFAQKGSLQEVSTSHISFLVLLLS